MTRDDLITLGPLAFGAKFGPLKGRIAQKTLIVGFDTEYDSKTRELLSVQFSYEGKGDWYIIPRGLDFTWEYLSALVCDFLERRAVSIANRHCRAIKLVTYFSLAETQHISDLTRATIMETSVGVDFVYKSHGGRTIEVVDLMKFFNNPPKPLAAVAESFGVQKLEWDTTQVNRRTLRKKGFREYAINDAIITETVAHRLRDEFINRFGVDILLTKTPAQTSATIFRKEFLTTPIDPPQPRVRKLAMLCAWGGRNEAFRRGSFDGTLHEYDAFSEYPNCAIEIGTLPRADDWLVTTRREQIEKYHGLAFVRFKFPPHVAFPCLPMFYRNKLLYPLSGESWATNAEIRLAYEMGARIRIVEGYHYRNGITDLGDYMRVILRDREKAKEDKDEIRAHVLKLALNSLIGKFLQRVNKIDLNALILLSDRTGVPIHSLKRLDAESREQLCREFGVEVDKLHSISLGSAFCPEWNALVLGYARAATSRFIYALNAANCVPCIVSTDSVIFAEREPLNTDTPFMMDGIRFRHQATGNAMDIVRTRLYRLQQDNKTVKIAHHAIAGKQRAETMFDFWRANPEENFFEYNLKRITKLRESLSNEHAVYGADVFADRKVALHFDYKRALDRNETRPLIDRDEHDKYLLRR